MSTPAERLRQRISDTGRVTFAEFMSEALYGEGGYYRRVTSPIGPLGDFVTGSSLSPMFARATAELVRRLDTVLGRSADVLEVGYGDGRHLKSLEAVLADDPPRRILALDRVARPLGDRIETLVDLAELDGFDFRGLVFSYELFDALPVHRLIAGADGELGELWVDLDDDGRFCYREGELSAAELTDCIGNERLVPGQIVDVSPAWGDLYRRLATLLGAGLIVTFDYGFERSRLFDPRVRPHGTLACYRRQRVHRNALEQVGDQDLTAHVDLTALRLAGESAGLETIALSRQARWLMACGIFDELEEADAVTRVAALDLLNAEGMGEEVRVLVQGRGVEAAALFDLEVLGG